MFPRYDRNSLISLFGIVVSCFFSAINGILVVAYLATPLAMLECSIAVSISIRLQLGPSILTSSLSSC